MAGPVRIAILADGRGARREFDTTGRSARSMGDVIGRAARIGAIGLAAGLGAAALAAKEFAEGAAQDQTSTALLARSLKNSAGATKAQIAATEAYITKQGELYGVTDDDLRPALARLVTASGSVTTALKDASLAEDVAAGKGKSLESVTTALARARTGSLAGLSRLGVATKDASGKSLTLSQILDSLKDKFKGAATTKAGTLQGQIDRLKVLASETGEAIGYKLLPPLADFAESAADGGKKLAGFVDTNVGPKLQALAGYFSDNRDEIVDLAKRARDDLVPFLSQAADLATDAGQAFSDTALPIARDLVPALGDLARIGTSVLSFVNGLPGPVKKLGGEVVIAALVLPRLTAGLDALKASAAATGLGRFTADLRAAETQAERTAVKTQALGSVARGAAGVGGILALASSAQTSNESLKNLGQIGGGALLGFQLAGPYGAAIGAGAGALLGLATQTDKAKEAAERAKVVYDGLVTTLDQVTGATTEATKAAIYDDLQRSGALKTAAQYGLSGKTVVAGVLGEKAAREQLLAVISTQRAEGERYAEEANRLNTQYQGVFTDRQAAEYEYYKSTSEQYLASADALEQEIGGQKRAVDAVRAKALATTDYAARLKGLPKRLVTQVEQDGLKGSIDQVARLTQKYNLTPKKVRTLIQAEGIDASVKDVQRVIDRINAARKTKGDLPNLASGISQSIRVAERAATQGGASIADNVAKGSKNAKADLPRLKPSVRTAASGAAAIATIGGTSIGSNLQSGIVTGFAGTQARLVRAAGDAVRAAVAAGKAAGKIQSPSKETEYLGRMLGDGFVLGMNARQGAASAAGADLVNAALASIASLGAQSTSGVAAGNVETAVTGVTDLIAKTYGDQLAKVERLLAARATAQSKKAKKKLDGKAEQKALARIDKIRDAATKAAQQQSKSTQSKINAGLQTQYDSLRRIAAAYDVISDQLATAQQTYEGLVEQAKQYAATVRDGVVASGSVVGLGANSRGVVSLQKLLSQLQAKVATAEAYSQTIQALTAAGLNQTTLQQLIDAGVEGGLGTAKAILAGGPAAISQINTLTDQLTATATQLGQTTADAMYGAGIQAAQGLVAGLQAQAAAAQAEAFAIGQQIAAGLAAGLASASAPKAAEVLADSVTKKAKKKLKVKSPSQVFVEIGQNVSKGLAIGLDEIYVTRAAGRLAGAVETGFGTPNLDAFMSQARATASAPEPAMAGTGGAQVPLIGNVYQQPGESTDQFAERLWFKLRSRG